MRNRQRQTTGLALAALLLATAAKAQTPPVANPDPAAVQAGDYAVEPIHTRVVFSVSHMGFNDWYGQFTGISGELKLDPRKPEASSVDITIPMANITTTNTTLDGELKSADWFDAERFPSLHFVSVKVVKTGARRAYIVGNLTLHGVTKPVILDARFNAAGVNPLSKTYTAGFHATAKVKRSDFGVMTYLPLIGDDVEIRISAAFERKAS
jgi:polyisoprenoid-binding protein YceI